MENTKVYVAVLWGWDGIEDIKLFSTIEKTAAFIAKQPPTVGLSKWECEGWDIDEAENEESP